VWKCAALTGLWGESGYGRSGREEEKSEGGEGF